MMEKKELTQDEQNVLSCLVLIDEYVKQNNISDNCDKTSLYDQFTQIFDGMGENGDVEQQHVFYKSLVSLNEKKYIVFEDCSYTFDDGDDPTYKFGALEIREKGADYVHKYMKLDTEKLEVTTRKIPVLNLQDLENLCKKINGNEIFKFITSLLP